jgi:hypothetical protein
MATPSTYGDSASRAEVASYVASLSADLAALARQTNLEMLTYLLEMVRLEAQNEMQQVNGSGRT